MSEMHIRNFCDNSVQIANDNSSRTPSGKRRVYSVSDRHNEDRKRKSPDIFLKASYVFLIMFYLFRSLPTSCRCQLDPCYVKAVFVNQFPTGKYKTMK